MRPARRALRGLRLALLLTLAAAIAVGAAQPQLRAPPDRLVPPGDFATLVFRVALPGGAEAAEVPLELEIDPAWRVVRRPDAVALEPDDERFVPVTVEVPTDAGAGSEATATLRSGVAEATVRLTVAARRALDLAAPDLVVLGGDPLRARVRNLGNVAVAARLELRLDGVPVDEATLELPPSADLSVPLEPVATGFHQLVLSGLDEPVRRRVEVIRFGVPPPEPLRLAGALSVRGGRASGAFDGELELELAGPLSDFVTLELFATDEFRSSYAEFERTTVEDARWRLRIGDLRRSALGPGLPDAFGVRLVVPAADRRSAVALGARDGAPSVWLATERVRPPANGGSDRRDGGAGGEDANGEVANGEDAPALSGWTETIGFAVGTDRGALEGRLRVRYESQATEVDGAAALRLGADDRDLSLRVEVERERTDPEVDLRAEFELADLLGEASRLALGGRARTPIGDELYAGVRFGLHDATASWRLGGVQRLPIDIPGRFRQLLQVGAPLSFAELRHDLALGSGWQTQNGIGVRFDGADRLTGTDTAAAELLLRSSWVFTEGPDNGVQANGELRWRPADGRIGGAVGGRLERLVGPFEIAAAAGWDLDADEVEVESRIGTDLESWRLEAEGGLLWRPDAAPTWRAALSATWRFDLPPPPAVVAAAGGRDLGTLRLLLRSGDEALEGVVVRAGRYRLATDVEGVAEARFEPGPVDLRVELGSLPVAYALDGPAELRVDVVRQETTEVAFPLVRTAELRGQVLRDSDADGVADVPARGVRAALLLRGARGVTRVLRTDDDGAFVARGLLPGEIDLLLTERPFGSTVVGPVEQRLRLRAGESATAVFLVQPAEAVARSFGGGAPRIGALELQAERVPPGAAPWISVTLRGADDAATAGAEVVLLAGGAERALERRGEAWIGRVPVPADAPAGVLPFEVEVRRAGEARTRRGQLLVDPTVALASFAVAGPVAPGASGALSAEVLADAVAVTVRSPFRTGERTPLERTAPGVWSGALPVPSDAADAVYTVRAEVRLADGTVLPLEERLRVLR